MKIIWSKLSNRTKDVPSTWTHKIVRLCANTNANANANSNANADEGEDEDEDDEDEDEDEGEDEDKDEDKIFDFHNILDSTKYSMFTRC